MESGYFDDFYHTDKKIRDVYKFEEELGRGSFSIVRRAVHRKTGVKYAVKVIKLDHQDEDQIQANDSASAKYRLNRRLMPLTRTI